MSNNVDYGEVMHKFYAGRQYGVRGPNYEDITWLEDVAKPTRAELETLWEQIKHDVARKRIHDARSSPGVYPQRDAMIVALWEKIMEGRPEAADELQAIRVAVKQQLPLPPAE